MKRGLGKGLGALMADAQTPSGDGVAEVDLLLIDNDPNQPRKTFDPEKLKELAQSVAVHGIMQPILVYEKEGRYQIVAGERRFRAAKLAGLKQVPVLIRQFTDKEILELSLIENIQREDLNPIEQAAALNQLVTQYGLKQEEVAERVGKSRSAIANLMRLLALPETVRQMVLDGTLSAGHARCLLPLETEAKIIAAAKTVTAQGLSVRQAEELVRNLLRPEPQKKNQAERSLPIELAEAQEALCTALSTKIQIKGDLKKGKIIIDYYTKEQLEALYELLKTK